ncbi:glycoprotein-N-acetylgalactosamine 3-beta-galactosyltransferase 1-like [Littorina saxatilis]|uniref:Glycoprotein-N-acetylgalactosamine 3-beta-galactosyltransferase 1 n=1 Tax=Littorina saxatilis TaxID=31220 RepID=A0AAN9GJW5_9CAEN
MHAGHAGRADRQRLDLRRHQETPILLRLVMAMWRNALAAQFCAGLALGLTVSFLFFGNNHIISSRVGIRLTRDYDTGDIGHRGDVRKMAMHSGNDEWSEADHEALDRHGDGQSDNSFLINDHHMHEGDDDSAARELAKKVKVMIWVMTSPSTLHDRAKAVRDTWGQRAEQLLFFSSAHNKTFPTIGLNVSEGREHLTAKTMLGFRYLYDNHFDEADWFMKVDDDTYVIMENLRYFLSEENPKDPVYFGHHFGLIAAQGYYSGGGGYVLSKEALRRFGQKGQDPMLCKQDGGAEDAEFGKCMERLGVKTVNTTDTLGRSRFHCFDPETHIMGGYPPWYYKYDANGGKKGLHSISDYAVTFHYIYPSKMKRLEFYIYHMAAYGVKRGFQQLNNPPKDRVPIKPIYRNPPKKT